MANIDTELSTIATAVYGSEMRAAIHDAIEKVNNEGTAPSSITRRTIEFGELGVTPFFGSCTFETNGSVVIFRMTIQPNPSNPYVRPSGTVIDNTGYTLFEIPSEFRPSQTLLTAPSIETHVYPFATDAHGGDVPYVDVYNNELRLYYGWNDVMTEEYPSYYANGMYFKS